MGESQKHVAVLMGGWSAEREVSLVSGKAVAAALEALGHRVTPIDPPRDAHAIIHALTKPEKPDVIFNALHGRGGEDGTIQGLLDLVGVPYTHSGVLASAVAMDKPLMKSVVTQAGVRCAEGRVVTHEELRKRGYPLPPPFVVKPPNEGSSVGVKIIHPGDNLAIADRDNWSYGDVVLIEKFVPGHELTVALMADGSSVRALAVTELRPRHEFYDYTAKYTDGVTEHLLPAPIPAEVYDAALRMAEAACRAIGCRGVARVDFRWDDTLPGSTGLHFLELNTQPGFTPLSLVPEQAAYAGLDFNALVAWILEHASCPA
jgi:D-alanine-D-alanine ligase